MPVRVYRVCRAEHAALDGAGAKLAGGRWNSSGRAVVYMAESISLAVLENLVHMSKQDFPSGYVTVAAVIPDGVEIIAEEDLRRQMARMTAKALGNRWLDSRASAVLRVRSAVVRAEHNYLLNPLHPQFSSIAAEPPVPFDFDARLFP